jgi:hypothetical protein
MNLFFTIVNSGYKFFALNFMKRWEQLYIENDLIFVCTDEEVFHFLKKYNAKCILKLEFISKNFQEWDTESYKELVFKKLDITNEILLQHQNQYQYITYIDTDIWININFMAKFNKILINNTFDIIFQDGEDYLNNIEESCSLIDNQLVEEKICNNYCTGFMCFNTKNLDYISNLLKYTEQDFLSFYGNQKFINYKLRTMPHIKKLVLPKIKLLNFSSLYFKFIPDYWALHYNYLIGLDKIYYMKKYNHWLL